MPRFKPENFAKNLGLLPEYAQIAREVGCTMSQLALAWVLARDSNIIPVFGTSKPEHVVENAASASLQLDRSVMKHLDDLINQRTVTGNRYSDATQDEIDTEVFRT
jgi:aryl-alcohol dehydrogenase-like predicted oxidoreductase